MLQIRLRTNREHSRYVEVQQKFSKSKTIRKKSGLFDKVTATIHKLDKEEKEWASVPYLCDSLLCFIRAAFFIADEVL